MKFAFIFLICFFNGLVLAEPETTISISGRYEYRTDTESMEMLGGLVCFYPNIKSVNLLPRPQTDQRMYWFCFKNSAQAQQLFGVVTKSSQSNCGVTGSAIVTISGYEAYLGEGDGFDTAILQAVKDNSDKKIISCM
jgi:hypothetical protein